MGIFGRRNSNPWLAAVSAAIESPPAALGFTPKADERGDELGARYDSLGLGLPRVLLLGMAGDTPVFGWAIERGDPLEHWRALRAHHADTGMWPFLLGKPDGIGETLSLPAGTTSRIWSGRPNVSMRWRGSAITPRNRSQIAMGTSSSDLMTLI